MSCRLGCLCKTTILNPDWFDTYFDCNKYLSNFYYYNGYATKHITHILWRPPPAWWCSGGQTVPWWTPQTGSPASVCQSIPPSDSLWPRRSPSFPEHAAGHCTPPQTLLHTHTHTDTQTQKKAVVIWIQVNLFLSLELLIIVYCCFTANSPAPMTLSMRILEASISLAKSLTAWLGSS